MNTNSILATLCLSVRLLVKHSKNDFFFPGKEHLAGFVAAAAIYGCTEMYEKHFSCISCEPGISQDYTFSSLDALKLAAIRNYA